MTTNPPEIAPKYAADFLAKAAEKDPHGKSQHERGAKLDAGKPRLSMVLGGFSRALRAVGEVGTLGAIEYTDDGWTHVPNGEQRYTDAMLRHYFDEQDKGLLDKKSGKLHAAHCAWNALARLDLAIRREEALKAESLADDAHGVTFQDGEKPDVFVGLDDSMCWYPDVPHSEWLPGHNFADTFLEDERRTGPANRRKNLYNANDRVFGINRRLSCVFGRRSSDLVVDEDTGRNFKEHYDKLEGV